MREARTVLSGRAVSSGGGAPASISIDGTDQPWAVGARGAAGRSSSCQAIGSSTWRNGPLGSGRAVGAAAGPAASCSAGNQAGVACEGRSSSGGLVGKAKSTIVATTVMVRAGICQLTTAATTTGVL